MKRFAFIFLCLFCTSMTVTAQITDANWSTMGTGADGLVRCITVGPDGNVYIGGDFLNVGGVSAPRIAMWNGSEWSPVGTGCDGNIATITFGNTGILYAGGTFSNAGGFPAPCIAKWNGSAWSSLDGTGTGLNDAANSIVCDSSGNLYVGGSFTNAGGVAEADFLAKYTVATASWSAVGTGTVTVNNIVYAVSLNSDGTALYIGGIFNNIGVIPIQYVAYCILATGEWAALDNSTNDMVYRLAFDGIGRLYATGWFTLPGSRIFQSYQGSTNTLLGGANNVVSGIGSDSNNNMYAGGIFTTVGSGTAASRIAKWDPVASAWSALGSGVDRQVMVITVNNSTGVLYAGGDFTTAGGISANKIAKCNLPFTATFAAGPGGTITGGSTETVPSGSTCGQRIAFADTGYTFVNWTDNTAAVVTTNSSLFAGPITRDRTFTANFTRTACTVNFAAGTGGIVVGTTPQTVLYGGDCTLVSAAANHGYIFVNWTDELAAVASSSADFTATNITANKTFTANFGLDTTVNVFLGAIVNVTTTSVGIAGDFTKKPRVRGAYTDPLLTTIKFADMSVIGTVPATSVNAKWTKPIKLYNKHDLAGQQISAWLAGHALLDVSLETQAKSSQIIPNNTWVVATGITAYYRNLVITGLGGTATPGTSMTIPGYYFGEKAPKVLIEYQKAGKWLYKSCKIDKSHTYIYQNAKGVAAKSCTKILAADPLPGFIGDSIVVFTYPTLPTGAVASGYIILDNGSGLATVLN